MIFIKQEEYVVQIILSSFFPLVNILREMAEIWKNLPVREFLS